MYPETPSERFVLICSTIMQYQQQQKALQDSNGTLRSVSHSSFNTPKSGPYYVESTDKSSQPKTSSTSQDRVSRTSSPRWRPKSLKQPAETLVKGKQRRDADSAKFSESFQQSNLISRLQMCQTSTPITPSIESGDMTNREQKRINHLKQWDEQRIQPQPLASSPRLRSSRMPRVLSPSFDESRNTSFTESADMTFPELEDQNALVLNTSRDSNGTISSHVLSGTPDLGIHLADIESEDRPTRPRPSILDTAAAQDASLPSPRLSPVTAAANIQNRDRYFPDTDRSSSLSQSHEHMESYDSGFVGSSSVPSDKPFVDQDSSLVNGVAYDAEQVRYPTAVEIPQMLDTFEAMPTEMKTYVMYQLLRRCPKKALHFVADVVNPALKCDFLNLLPLELCLNVIGYLDVKSLCRAAQVSKKWRNIINSDEKAWKQLFDTDGYTLPEGELQRAIYQGWGWQIAYGADNWERDLSTTESNPELLKFMTSSSGMVRLPSLDSPSIQTQNSQGRRSKRKAAPKPKLTSRKQQKRKDRATKEESLFDTDAWTRNLYLSEGPYAAASAAAVAVRYPEIGLPSLKNLHLHKSIYQRHYLIRKSWMQDEIKPKHIAFKAHQRHVVTCLQFDTDKIITGSDDTNINVYDTRSGALRARLEGHEGGVWALQYEGNVLVSGSTDRSVRVWDIEKGICTHVFQGHTSTVRCLQILLPTPVGTTPEGKSIMMPKQPLIITGSRDSNLRVWKLPKPGDQPFVQAGPAQDELDCPYFVRTLSGHIHSVRAIAAHADTLISGSYDHSVRVWRISTGETVHRLQGHMQKVYSVVLDHKRNRCISGSMDNLVKVWSLDTGSVLYNLEGHSSLVGLLDLQQDRLVSAAADSTLRIWDPENGHCKSTLSAHTGAITCFQHDGQKVISGSDRTLKMWNAQNGEFVKDLLTDLSGVWQVKFDERRCVAAVQRNNLTYIEASYLQAGFGAITYTALGSRLWCFAGWSS